MAKKKAKESCDCGCCCSKGRFWWGVLAGIVVAVVVNVLICRHGCGMMGGSCPMMKGASAQAQSK